MKARFQAVFVCWFMAVCGMIPLNGQKSLTQALDGCASVVALAGNVRQIVEMDWRSVTALNLQKHWSAPVEPMKCDDSTSCSLMVHNGRIINNRLECVDVFHFEAADATAPERLSSIVIHHTLRTRSAAVFAAQQLAQAAGLNSKDVSTIGKREDETFQWNGNKFGKEIYVLDVKFTKVENSWNLFFALRRDMMQEN